MTFPSRREAVFDVIQHGEERLREMGMDDPGVFDIVVHQQVCASGVSDDESLCDCEPTILHHGHEPGECKES